MASAARPPDVERAEALGREFVERATADELEAAWLREVVRPAALAELPPSAKRSYYHHVERSMGPRGGLGLTLAEGPEVLGVVVGPDYARIVFDTSPPLTAVVRRDGGATVVERFERSACGLCSEPERFVADLIADLQSGEAPPRLLPGVDLAVDATLEASVPTDWTYAWHARNTKAGYLRWLGLDAEVVNVHGQGVDVALADRTETWPVVYAEGRWMLDYTGLDEESPLRLADDELGRWRQDRIIAQHSVEWWSPVFAPKADGVLLAHEVRFVGPRPLQGDLLLYVQDLDRSFALVALVDPDSGEVRRRIGLPTLSKRENHDPDTWDDLFVGALSPDGKTLAIGAHRRLWLVDLASGEVLRTVYDVNGLRALAWSADGKRLALGDGRGVSLMEGEHFEDKARHWAETLSEVEGVVLDAERVWMVQEDGVITGLSPEDLRPEPGAILACCGAVRGVDRVRGSGEILVGCEGTCDPAWLWRWRPGGEPLLFADQQWRGSDGTISSSPDGRYLVGPTADGRAAIWDLRSESVLNTFSPVPLEQIAWGEERIYGVDSQARAWSWRLDALVP